VDPGALIDQDRYPLTAPGSARARSLLEELRRARAATGVAILPGFVRPEAVAHLTREVRELAPRAHHEDVSVGTPYLELPDTSYPEGHPRRTSVRSATWVLAYDQVPLGSALRALYEWDPLMHFIAEALERRPLYRFADPLGALNVAVMEEGDVQGWHYDSTDFVVSLALQSSRGGGHFECAAQIRSPSDENYDEVARVLRGEAPERVEVYPMTPGTLMLFEGRHSLHRVSPVQGERPRYVALLAYDTAPGTQSSDLLKLVRYGRTEAAPPPA
jgi:hypothetical protein